jgi:hypothetical protein
MAPISKIKEDAMSIKFIRTLREVKNGNDLEGDRYRIRLCKTESGQYLLVVEMATWGWVADTSTMSVFPCDEAGNRLPQMFPTASMNASNRDLFSDETIFEAITAAMTGNA